MLSRGGQSVGVLIAILVAPIGAADEPPEAPSLGDRALDAGLADAGTIDLVAPAMIQDSQARPVGIGGDVDLDITVDERGEVVEARVIQSPDPRLSDSALDAVGGLRFSPALRDGRPIEAAIGFRYHFAAPPPPPRALIRGEILSRGNRHPIAGAEIEAGLASAVSDEEGRFSLAVLPGTTAVAIRAAGFEARTYVETVAVDQELAVRYRLTPTSSTPFETIVRTQSERTELSRVTLQGSEIHDVAGTFGDPLRVVMLLPGVGSVLSGVAYPVVRGSDPADTGYYLDGIPIPILFHLYLGPEVISPDFVDQLDFYPGNPPADEGRHLTGAVSVTSKQPREKGLHASVYLDALNAGGFAELSIPSTGTSFAAAGRVSYSGLIAETLANALQPAGSAPLVLDFSDYQLRIDQLAGGGHVRLFVFGSNDSAGTGSTPTHPASIANIDFLRADLRYQHPVGEGLGEVGFTFGNDDVGFTSNPQLTLDVQSFRLRASWKGDSSPALHWLVGADVDYQRARLSSTSVNFLSQGFLGIGSADASFSGVWTELTWKPGGGWSLTPALRLDNYFRSPQIDDLAVEPRLTVRYQVRDNLALTLGAGLAHQPPVLLVNLPAVDLGALGHGLQEGLQTELGSEWTFFRGNRLDLTAYFNPLFRTVELGFPGGPTFNSASSGTQPQVPDPVTHGYAFGFELLLRHPLGGNWFGWLSYSLSWSLRDQTFPQLDGQGNAVGLKTGLVPFAFDETHIANAVLTYRFPHGWSVGGVLHFNSGRPESGVLGSYTQVQGTSSSGQAAWIPVELDKVQRLPPFFRADVRVAKTFNFDQIALEVYLDCLNATFSWETVGYDYAALQTGPPGTAGPTTLTRTATTVPIVVPMIGLRATY